MTTAKDIKILVASHNLPVGSVVTSNDLHWQTWPKNSLSAHYFQKENTHLQNVVGWIVRTHIVKDQPITQNMLGQHGGLLARQIKPLKRALTIPITSTIGIPAHVTPGDRVDTILTREIAGPPKQFVSETILTNILVLGIGNTLDRKKPASKPAKGIQKYLPKVVPAPVKNKLGSAPTQFITLELTAPQAEAIILSLSVGKIAFSLRASERGGIAQIKLPVRPFTTTNDISQITPSRAVSIYRGEKEITVFVEE